MGEYLARRFAPSRIPTELTELIHRRTEGHPLFVSKLAGFLAERGEIIEQEREWVLARPVAEMDIEIPESVRGMVRRKLEALGGVR